MTARHARARGALPALRRSMLVVLGAGALVAAAAPGGQRAVQAVARPTPAPCTGACAPPPGALVRRATPRPTPVPTPAPTPVPTTRPAPRPTLAAPPAIALPVHVGAVFAVGDSVTLDIAGALERDVPGTTVDGKVGRQFSAGIEIVDALRRSGRLPPTVVVALGTNGTVSSQQFDAMMAAAAGAKRVVFVTVHVPRSWQDEVNSVIHAGAARYPNVAIADWYALSAGHTSWFAPDGYHLTQPGANALAALIASVV